MDPADFECLDRVTISGLAAALRRAGFDDGLLGRAESIAPRRLDPVRLPVVRTWLADRGGAGPSVARLFAYADAVPTDAVVAALGRDVFDALRRAGMLVDDGDRTRARIRIVPFCGLHLASDPMETAGDPVMGPGAFTQEMADLMPIDAGARVLDVGSGAGSLALVAAARGAGEVVGVDLHPRAEAVARFNAALNDLTAEFLTSDLTAAVAGRRFDLVVAQPPFVVKPDDVDATTYLHAGPEGDELALRLCGELCGVLAPGGRALVLLETLRDVPAVAPRVGEAFGDGPIDAIVIATPGTSFDLLAIGYASVAHPALGDDYAATAARYLRHLHRYGSHRTVHVLVDARRDDTRPEPRAVTVERAGLGGMRADDLRALEAAVQLALADPATLAAATVVVPAGAVVTETIDLADGRAEVRIRWAGGGRDEQVLTDAARVVVETARTPVSIAALTDAFAAAAGASPGDVADRVLAFVRAGLGSGLLVPG